MLYCFNVLWWNFSAMHFISGGREAQKGKWSWQVAILNRYREVICGGTLVDQGWVLTAAHCVRKHLFVRLGEHNLIKTEVNTIGLKHFI